MKKKVKVLSAKTSIRKTITRRAEKKISYFSIIFFIVFGILVIGVVGIIYNEIAFEKEILDNSNVYGEFFTLGVFKIGTANPDGNTVSFFVGENKTFSISNNNYDSILWSLDGTTVNINSNEILISGLSVGNHTLEVLVSNATQSDLKTWNITVEDVDVERAFKFNTGYIMFFVILVVVVLIIMMLVWLILHENTMRIEQQRLIVSRNDPVLDLNPVKRNG
jgi:hypothetical protein